MSDALGIIFLSTFAVGICGIVGAILGQRFERRRIVNRINELAGLDDSDPERLLARLVPNAMMHTEENTRLNRIEDAVESIAIEVERVAEGQRFVTRLIGDRMLEPPARPSRSPIPPAGRHPSPNPAV